MFVNHPTSESLQTIQDVSDSESSKKDKKHSKFGEKKHDSNGGTKCFAYRQFSEKYLIWGSILRPGEQLWEMGRMEAKMKWIQQRNESDETIWVSSIANKTIPKRTLQIVIYIIVHNQQEPLLC